MKTILIVDDDKNQLLLYKQELSLEGYGVITAKDGIEAIQKVRDHFPDLVVMDINMPKMNGIESMGKILSEHKETPVIINTAYSSYQDNFMTWLADAYVVKSSDLSVLKNKIKELID
ncbi:MAG: response regulator [Candidatus Loosdrechtia sp.]|uniref:response regulator n=1 Tax=Candidatus Loosdrechtia sp. TaxID=3101272 RepID=UPI003A617748|nr:MAG: response regulator [Candidatus Jettenia sp. AMX2]